MKPLQLSEKNLLVQLARFGNSFAKFDDLCGLLWGATFGLLLAGLLVTFGSAILGIMVLEPLLWALAWANGFYVSPIDVPVLHAAMILWSLVVAIAAVGGTYYWYGKLRNTKPAVIISSVVNRYCIRVEITRAN